MCKRILLVDDEVNLLQSLRRNLRGRYELTLAEGGEAGLEQLRTSGPFAIVVSDMQMPEVDGLTLLRHAKDLSPDTVRIMLTGNVDQETAVKAVNTGAIFRFLNKPCAAEVLAEVLDEGLRQYALVEAEKILLSQTLTGSVAMMTELMAIANPVVFGRAGRLRSLARRVTTHFGWADAWQYEVAAMLSQIGCVGSQGSERVAGDEKDLPSQAELSSSLVGRIPRLERIAAMIGRQYELDESADIPPGVRNGAQLLRILCEFDQLNLSHSLLQAVQKMKLAVGTAYDETIFQGFSEVMLGTMEYRSLPVHELLPRMILEESVENANGDILISKGHELTDSLIQRLNNFRRNAVGVREPISVCCPAGTLEGAGLGQSRG